MFFTLYLYSVIYSGLLFAMCLIALREDIFNSKWLSRIGIKINFNGLNPNGAKRMVFILIFIPLINVLFITLIFTIALLSRLKRNGVIQFDIFEWVFDDNNEDIKDVHDTVNKIMDKFRKG